MRIGVSGEWIGNLGPLSTGTVITWLAGWSEIELAMGTAFGDRDLVFPVSFTGYRLATEVTTTLIDKPKLIVIDRTDAVVALTGTAPGAYVNPEMSGPFWVSSYPVLDILSGAFRVSSPGAAMILGVAFRVG